MKRRSITLFLIFIITFGTFSGFNGVAHAFNVTPTPQYLRVIDDTTPLFSDESGSNLLFYLPYTYYVRVINVGEKFAHVECYGEGLPALDGYAPTDMLYNDNLKVDSPYPTVTLKTSTQTVLYADTELTKPLQYLFAERELCYYGNLGGETSVYCVGYNGKLGYVTEEGIYPFDLPLHPNELTFIEPEPVIPEMPSEETPNPSEGDGLLSLRIIVIACLVSAGVIALLLALRKKPKKHQTVGYYDENDYE